MAIVELTYMNMAVRGATVSSFTDQIAMASKQLASCSEGEITPGSRVDESPMAIVELTYMNMAVRATVSSFTD